MRVLLINPNTSNSITEQVLREARRIAPDMEFAGATGRLGARYISTRAGFAIAAHAALDAFAQHGADADAVILACFGDPGLRAIQEIAAQPVIGMAEAACREAAASGKRFSIVTGGERWPPILREYVDSLGLGHLLASVRVVTATGAQIAADPERSIADLGRSCLAAAQDDGAESVILGGAGLVGLAARIAPQLKVPLIDALESSIRAVRLSLQSVPKKAGKTDPVDSIGLSHELASLLTGTPK